MTAGSFVGTDLISALLGGESGFFACPETADSSSLALLDKKLIAKIVLQEYSQEEAARLIGCGRRHAVRCFPEALDRVSEMFLKKHLLARLPGTKSKSGKSCQGGKNDEFLVSDSEQAKNNS